MNNIEINFGNDEFKIQAELKMDGDMWSVGIGKDIQVGVYGEGHNPAEAIQCFKDNFRNYVKPKRKG